MLFRWTHPCGQWFLRPCGPRCYCDTCLVPTWFYSWAPAASVLSLGHAQFLVYSITNLVVQQIDIPKVMISLHILLATIAHICHSSICIWPTGSFCYYHVVEVVLGMHGCDLSKEKKVFCWLRSEGFSQPASTINKFYFHLLKQGDRSEIWSCQLFLVCFSILFGAACELWLGIIIIFTCSLQ